MLSKQIYKEEQKQFEKQIKQVENKRSNKYHLIQMRDHIIPNQSNFVIKDQEDPSAYFGVPYRSEIQTPKLDEFSSDKQIKRKISR